MNDALPSLRQAWPLPAAMRPIVIIGAGGIVNDAHLPAYRQAGLPVAGVFDIDPTRARELADRWDLPTVYASLEDALAQREAVFDLATPPAAQMATLNHLPIGAAVLIQQPFGLDLADAAQRLGVCHERRLTASVNFQLRYAPMMLALRDALERGLLGQLLDVEVHVNLATPWHLFPQLKANDRVEIVSHSIHYLDLIRGLMGDPGHVKAGSYRQPGSGLADTRTTALLDFDSDLRCTLSINHHHDFGRRFQDALLRFEGSEGAAVVKLGLLLNYPDGEPDELWLCRKGSEWQQVPLQGAWFPEAFIGSMANLQRFASGEDEQLETAVDDAWHTMALVEACYHSGATPGTPVPRAPSRLVSG